MGTSCSAGLLVLSSGLCVTLYITAVAPAHIASTVKMLEGQTEGQISLRKLDADNSNFSEQLPALAGANSHNLIEASEDLETLICLSTRNAAQHANESYSDRLTWLSDSVKPWKAHNDFKSADIRLEM